MLKAKGVTGKSQEIKGVKMEEEEMPRVTFGPEHPLPEPEEAICSIGNIAKAATKSFDKAKVSDSVKYAKGDSIPFFSTNMHASRTLWTVWHKGNLWKMANVLPV